MTLVELEKLLRAWAKEYGQRPPVTSEGWDEGEGSEGFYTQHPLARAQEFAPGTAKAVLVTYRRDGSDRRRRMAEAVGLPQMRVVGMGYVDPVPCIETRPDRRTPMHVSRPQPEEDVERVQRHVMAMIEACPEYGNALQIHYCTRGGLMEKAIELAWRVYAKRDTEDDHKQGKAKVPVRAYRSIVAQAKCVLLGRMG